MKTEFIKLNSNWNAHPVDPDFKFQVDGTDLEVFFNLNHLVFKQYKEENVGHLLFKNCWRYRLGSTNDEGWYCGQCRFSKIAPGWGEFYEVQGDLKLNKDEFFEIFGEKHNKCPHDWFEIGKPTNTLKHFLFYLKDYTFECDADDWSFKVT